MATTTSKRALKDSGTCGSGSAEESGTLQQTAQGRVEARKLCDIHSFLSQTPDQPGHVSFRRFGLSLSLIPDQGAADHLH